MGSGRAPNYHGQDKRGPLIAKIDDPQPKKALPMIETVQSIDAYEVHPNQRSPTTIKGAPKSPEGTGIPVLNHRLLPSVLHVVTGGPGDSIPTVTKSQQFQFGD